VPTPFYHLSIADEILSHPGLADPLRQFLGANASAFLFGKVAPDVQVVSGERREVTHFYTLPPADNTPAWQRMLKANPSLADPAEMSSQRAAFLAGYCCHLQADEHWLFNLFIPVFGPDAQWADFRQRLYLHNVLRAYLDHQVLSNLSPQAGPTLQAAQPEDWLPFAAQAHLIEWRDYLAAQLQPGAAIQTIEVFAERQGLPAESFRELLGSKDKMKREIFAHISKQKLSSFRAQVVEKNIALLTKYLSSHPALQQG